LRALSELRGVSARAVKRPPFERTIVVSNTFRRPLFTVRTPIPNTLRDVTLYEDTWRRKIEPNHPEMAGKELEVEQTLQWPTAIYASGTTVGNFVFVNDRIRDRAGRSLRVAVKPVGLDGEVRSAYHDSATPTGVRIWP
jgi:hypothetical protein